MHLQGSEAALWRYMHSRAATQPLLESKGRQQQSSQEYLTYMGLLAAEPQAGLGLHPQVCQAASQVVSRELSAQVQTDDAVVLVVQLRPGLLNV